MNRQSQEDAVFQDSQNEDSSISEDNMPKGFHGFMMGHMGHQDVTPSRNKRMRPLPIVPIMLLIMVVLHILAAIFLSKTGSGALSFNNPMSYGMIGLLFIFAIAKLKHVLGFLRGKGKQSARGITNGVSGTSSVERE
jgi:hypothetical protein